MGAHVSEPQIPLVRPGFGHYTRNRLCCRFLLRAVCVRSRSVSESRRTRSALFEFRSERFCTVASLLQASPCTLTPQFLNASRNRHSDKRLFHFSHDTRIGTQRILLGPYSKICFISFSSPVLLSWISDSNAAQGRINMFVTAGLRIDISFWPIHVLSLVFVCFLTFSSGCFWSPFQSSPFLRIFSAMFYWA